MNSRGTCSVVLSVAVVAGLLMLTNAASASLVLASTKSDQVQQVATREDAPQQKVADIAPEASAPQEAAAKKQPPQDADTAKPHSKRHNHALGRLFLRRTGWRIGFRW
jgi:uncharacterized membrane protein